MSWWPWRKKQGVSKAVLDERAKTAVTFQELHETQARTPEIQALSDRMVSLKVRNHFGDALVLAMMRKD